MEDNTQETPKNKQEDIGLMKQPRPLVKHLPTADIYSAVLLFGTRMFTTTTTNVYQVSLSEQVRSSPIFHNLFL